VKHRNLLGERKETTRGLVILVARLTARQHKRIFLLCHYFAITNQLWENESCHVGRNERQDLPSDKVFKRGKRRLTTRSFDSFSRNPFTYEAPCAPQTRQRFDQRAPRCNPPVASSESMRLTKRLCRCDAMPPYPGAVSQLRRVYTPQLSSQASLPVLGTKKSPGKWGFF
jgi:hypothetical protein